MTDKPKWTDLFGIDPDYTKDAAEEPTLTAAEVRVLTEAALRLGRKEAGEEIAARLDQLAENYQSTAVAHRDLSDRTTAKGQRHLNTAHAFRNKADGAWAAAHLAREIASQPSQAASDATSGVPGHQEVSEAVRSPQEDRCDSVHSMASHILCIRPMGHASDHVSSGGRNWRPRDITKGNTP